MNDAQINRANLKDAHYIRRQRHNAVSMRNHYRRNPSLKDAFAKLLHYEKEIRRWDELLEKAKCSSS